MSLPASLRNYMGRKPRYGQLLDHDPSLKINLSPFRCQPNATILKDGQDDWLKYRDKAYVLHGFFLEAPATAILQTSKHFYNSTKLAYYVRDPSPENDQRWDDLSSGLFLRLSQDDLLKIGRKEDAVQLPDGSGIGLVNAYHEIHCINSLYQYSHPEYYWPNATTEHLTEDRHHIDHCLDYLLQAAMCHGDVGFMTYHWDMAQPRPFWKAAEHTCINWDSLHHWVTERRAPVYEPGLLIHPIFGPVFPDGGVKIPTIGKSRAILLCEVLADVRPDDII